MLIFILKHRLLSARDLVIVVGGLQLCDNLLIKLPNIFKPRFLKEGVIHELQRLSKPLETSRSSSKLKSKLQDNSDLFQTPKSRRSIYSNFFFCLFAIFMFIFQIQKKKKKKNN